MPIANKPKTTLTPFSPAEIAAAKAAARPASGREKAIDWSKGVVTPGGGVTATIAAIHRTRGPGKKPAKEQVAIRLDPEVLGAFRAGGRGWQTRVNSALKEWLAAHPAKRSARGKTAA
jgi:uncharacterized protein (DUF4415 family)